MSERPPSDRPPRDRQSGGASAHPPAGPAVARAGPLALAAAGRAAFREVPGLRGLLLKGVVLLYGVFLAVGAVVLGLVYRFAIRPLSVQLSSFDAGGNVVMELLLPVATGLVWLGQALLLTATVLLSFVLSLALLSLWFEALTGRIVAHTRGGTAEAPFSLRAWAASLAQALRDSVLLLALAVVALLLGFVPLVGPFLAFALSCYVMGREVREPYLAVRAARGEALRDLRRGLWGWTLWVGVLPVVLALVPWLGWLLLPLVLTWQVAGVAWLSERGR
jgi:hypothetical protein